MTNSRTDSGVAGRCRRDGERGLRRSWPASLVAGIDTGSISDSDRSTAGIGSPLSTPSVSLATRSLSNSTASTTGKTTCSSRERSVSNHGPAPMGVTRVLLLGNPYPSATPHTLVLGVICHACVGVSGGPNVGAVKRETLLDQDNGGRGWSHGEQLPGPCSNSSARRMPWTIPELARSWGEGHR